MTKEQAIQLIKSDGVYSKEVIEALEDMTDNDYVAEYVREKHSNILGLDFVFWRVDKCLSITLSSFASNLSLDNAKKLRDYENKETKIIYGSTYCDDCDLLYICGKECRCDESMTHCEDKYKYMSKSVLDDIRAEIEAITISGQVNEHTSFIRTGEHVKQMSLDIIDKYRESEDKE